MCCCIYAKEKYRNREIKNKVKKALADSALVHPVLISCLCHGPKVFATMHSIPSSLIIIVIIRMVSALLLLLPVALAIDCPEGWLGTHGSCYLVSIAGWEGYFFNDFQTAPDKSMFFHAQEYCWEQGNLKDDTKYDWVDYLVDHAVE